MSAVVPILLVAAIFGWAGWNLYRYLTKGIREEPGCPGCGIQKLKKGRRPGK